MAVPVPSACCLAAELHAGRAVRSATGQQIRVAFLYQLAQYVTWPEDKTRETLRFCVPGNGNLADVPGGRVSIEINLTTARRARPVPEAGGKP